jgi:hypothetical protein
MQSLHYSEQYCRLAPVTVQEKMARGSGMLNIKPQAFFDAINSEATEDCFDGIHAAQVRVL